MPCDVNKLISVAKAELGYTEKETWDQLDDKYANPGDGNYVKYSRDLAQYSFYNSSKRGVAWCDIFADWCAYAAFGPNAAKKLLCQPSRSSGAGCKHSMNYYKAKGRFYESDPRPGDQIFFWPSNRNDPDSVQHTGWVVEVTSTRVYTIEGNTSAEDGVVDNGGCVAEKRYYLDFDRIAGYGRPDYDNIDPDAGYESNDSTNEVDNMAKKSATVVAERGDSVNMRKRPNTAGSIVMKVPVGANVTVNENTSEWAQIVYNGNTGYMMTKFLEFFDEEAAADDEITNLVNQINALVAELAARAT